MKPDRWRSAVPPLLVFIAAIIAWYAYSSAVGAAERAISAPYPHDVVRNAFLDGEVLSELLRATLVSTWIALSGLVIAMILGVGFAVLMSQATWAERSFYPYAVLLQTLPILALVPLIGLRLGFGYAARVVVVVLLCLFPIITNTLFGLKSADGALHDLFTLQGASRWTRLRKLQLPAALPAMFTGFQISAGLSVVGSIVGGFFFGRGEPGLGLRIKTYTNLVQVEELVGAITLSALLGFAVFWFFGWSRRRLTGHWAPTDTNH